MMEGEEGGMVSLYRRTQQVTYDAGEASCEVGDEKHLNWKKGNLNDFKMIMFVGTPKTFIVERGSLEHT